MENGLGCAPRSSSNRRAESRDHHLRATAAAGVTGRQRADRPGVAAGDRVAIYMPMIPQAVVAMLACARIGAPHSVIFGGFRRGPAQPHRRRAGESGHHQRRQFRRGSSMPLKPAVDEAVEHCPSVEKVVVRRTGDPVQWTTGPRPLVARWSRRPVTSTRRNRSTPSTRCSSCTPRARPERQGNPAHLRRIPHPGPYTHGNVFDLKPETDVYWCTADIGWVTGHSYIVYGPFQRRHPGDLRRHPDTPHKGRWWEIIEAQGRSIYTAPTAIRTFMKWGKEILPAAVRPVLAAAARLGG